MTFFNQYIVHFLIFSPLAAAIFITLIPSSDTVSKKVLSHFFSIIGFLAFVKILLLYENGNQTEKALFLLDINNLKIILNININKYNIPLYGCTSVLLIINMYFFEIRNIKSNIHQVSPFLLVFLLYICFGQTDLKIALPILSIANFLVYFMMGSGEKPRRGTAVFHMGNFLFFFDTLALILLQIFQNDKFSTSPFLSVLLLTPGMARLQIPIFSPFARKLTSNLNEEDGPFITIFEQMAGFLILTLVQRQTPSLDPLVSNWILITTNISIIYISIQTFFDRNIKLITHQFLIYYSSISAAILLLINQEEVWFLTTALFLTNITCFLLCTRLTIIAQFQRAASHNYIQWQSLCFVSLSMFIGIPGLGLGCAIWLVFYRLVTQNSFSPSYFYTYLTWLTALLILTATLLLTIRQNKQAKQENESELPFPLNTKIFFIPLIIVITSWLIPFTTLYLTTE